MRGVVKTLTLTLVLNPSPGYKYFINVPPSFPPLFLAI